MSAKISDELHRLKGSRPTRAAAEPAFTVAPGRPKMPKKLTEEQQAIFKRIRRLLEQRRACTHGDVEIITMYCVAYTRWIKALAKLEEEGEIRLYSRLDSNGKEVQTEKPNLWLRVAETCEKNLTAYLDRLGLSPLNRGKIKPTAAKETPKEPTAAELEEQHFLALLSRKPCTPSVPFVQPVYEEPTAAAEEAADATSFDV